jgi:hypothetical protein
MICCQYQSLVSSDSAIRVFNKQGGRKNEGEMGVEGFYRGQEGLKGCGSIFAEEEFDEVARRFPSPHGGGEL